jgi:dihydromethanopterin reductase (acceptor)
MSIAWAITGCGHYLTEALTILGRIPVADVFLSRAAEEVAKIYKCDLGALLGLGKDIYKERAFSSPIIGHLYHNRYELLVIAPATSNSVAKFVAGISDSLVSNLFAQAGKCKIPIIVLPTDTEGTITSPGPKGPVRVFPRPIDLTNTQRLREFRGVTVVQSPKELQQCLNAYL